LGPTALIAGVANDDSDAVTLTEHPPAPSAAPPPARTDPSSSFGTLVYVAVSGLVAVVALGLVVMGVIAMLRDDNDDAAAAPAAAATTLNVSLTEFSIDGQLTAPAGNVQVNVSNDGSVEHNFALVDPNVQSSNLMSGGSELLDLGTLAPGTYEVICTIPGHEASGMSTELVVTEPGAAAGNADAAGEMDHSAMGHDEMTSEQMDMLMVESMLAFPAETEGVGNQLLEYELMPDGTKQFELTAAVTPWEVAPGEFVDAWAYNGMVPGPMIKVDLGDKVRVILHNETPMGTDIHFHGIDTPNDMDGVAPYTQDVVSTGESFTYEFVADVPAIGMYHAHMHGQVSVPNGMFAAFTVGENPIPRGRTISGVTIPEDLVPAIDMPMVVNDAGVIGLTLNGKSFPATAPLVVDEGDWVALTYYNEGLMAHPMHLHKFPQLIYAKDGIPLDEPYWADTINVAPGERYSVLFQASEAGTWVWHCHILTHVESEEGMFGMATAVVVNPAT